MAHDVFISYASKDKTAADAVCATLEKHGVRCWIAPRDVLPGMEWGEAIIDAITGCGVMILVFSASANGSPQIRREVERAVNKGVTIMPLRIEDVIPSKALEYFIGNVHWLDALTPPLEQHLDHLAGTVKMLLARCREAAAAKPEAAPARAALPKVAAPAPIESGPAPTAAPPRPTAPVVEARSETGAPPPTGPRLPPTALDELRIPSKHRLREEQLQRREAMKTTSPTTVVTTTTATRPLIPRWVYGATGGVLSLALLVAVFGYYTLERSSSPKVAQVPSTTSAPAVSQPSASPPQALPIKPRETTVARRDIFDEVAEQPVVQYELGLKYDRGDGVPRDHSAAAEWYHKAAVQGNVAAQNRLGEMYAAGLGVQPNDHLAVKWFGKASDQGDLTARCNLGSMHRRGWLGPNYAMPRDFVRAYMWYELADGYTCAGEPRAELEEQMSPGQVAAAKQRAKEWLAKRPRK